MTIWLAAVVTLGLLMSISIYMQWHLQHGKAQSTLFCIRALERVFTLLQLLQKHRGLGAQQGGQVVLQREQIAYELDRQWSNWTQQCPDMKNLQTCWLGLKESPADFTGHCQLIDQLLGIIAVLERRIAAQQQQRVGTVAARCRGLEDLARLRGLASRAANESHCPIELEVPLRYLCRRLSQTEFQRGEAAVKMAIREICQRLLDAQYVSITATRCFELLTPIIDTALNDVRSTVQQWRTAPSVNESKKSNGFNSVTSVPVANFSM
jgi:hypothetical protein